MDDREYELLKRKLDLKEIELQIRRDELNFEIQRDFRYQDSHEAKKRNHTYEFKDNR